MSATYSCDRCGEPVEPEQAQGYTLEVEGFRITLHPMGQLCPLCIIALLQVAALSTERVDLEVGVH